MSYESIKAELDELRTAELATYEAYGELSEVKRAMQSGVMWNIEYTPAELGPMAPVSRGWDFSTHPTNTDFKYVIFDWDNIFASYLLSIDDGGKELAYSNMVQVVRSKTARGFIPNYSAGGGKSQDRTEPPIGAKVLLEMYNKHGDMWIVQLLFNDLVDWSDWFWRERLLSPLDLIALGSDATGYGDSDGSVNAMQGARYESGADNSPMYDCTYGEDHEDQGQSGPCDWFHPGEEKVGGYGLMQMADVGQTGEYVSNFFACAMGWQAARPLGCSARALRQPPLHHRPRHRPR